MDKAVILAAGMGRRMRSDSRIPHTSLKQAVMASTGIKTLIPIGRPFLEYVLAALGEAGYRQVCLVTGPQHEMLRNYCDQLDSRRLKISFACQQQPLGTADAVAAAADFVGRDHFLVINADNYYPAEVLHRLRLLDEPGLIGFDRDAILASGKTNITRAKMRHFAIVHADANGYLSQITEKPDEKSYMSLQEPVLVSINCWRFPSAILEACRAINRSPRGEFELPDAVEYARTQLGIPFRILVSSAAVLDLSGPADIEAVSNHLAAAPIQI